MIQKLFLVTIESKTYVSVRVTYDSVVNDRVDRGEGGRKSGRRESSRKKQVKSVSKPVWVKPKWLVQVGDKKLPTLLSQKYDTGRFLAVVYCIFAYGTDAR